MKVSDLPPTVVKTVHQKAPTAEIAHVTKIQQGDRVFYEVSFKDEAKNPKVLVDQEGMAVPALPER